MHWDFLDLSAWVTTSSKKKLLRKNSIGKKTFLRLDDAYSVLKQKTENQKIAILSKLIVFGKNLNIALLLTRYYSNFSIR